MGQSPSVVECEALNSIPETGAVFGFGQTPLSVSGPISVENETVVQMSTYCGHSALVCDSGRVYVFGDNFGGQLGLGCVGEPMSEPTLVEALVAERIVSAACGDSYTLFLADDGKVFACGENKNGQLGLGYKMDRFVPSLIESLPRIKQIATGYSHSVALTASGEVWVWGGNSYGQLGLDDENDRLTPAQLTVGSEPVKYISCGYLQTAFITESGALYKCGRNEKGELGVADISEWSSTPVLVLIDTPLASVACGEEHCVALADNGDVWTWGDNWYGQCGLKESSSSAKPRRMASIQDHRIVQVAAEYLQTALVTDKGDLFTFGMDASGQLCHGAERFDREIPTLVESFSPMIVKQVACGTSHTLVLAVPKSSEELSRMAQEEMKIKAMERERQLNKREQRLNEREQRMNEWEKRMNERERRMNDREERMDERERRIDNVEPCTTLPPAINKEWRLSFRKKKKEKENSIFS